MAMSPMKSKEESSDDEEAQYQEKIWEEDLELDLMRSLKVLMWQRDALEALFAALRMQWFVILVSEMVDLPSFFIQFEIQLSNY